MVAVDCMRDECIGGEGEGARIAHVSVAGAALYPSSAPRGGAAAGKLKAAQVISAGASLCSAAPLRSELLLVLSGHPPE